MSSDYNKLKKLYLGIPLPMGTKLIYSPNDSVNVIGKVLEAVGEGENISYTLNTKKVGDPDAPSFWEMRMITLRQLIRWNVRFNEDQWSTPEYKRVRAEYEGKRSNFLKDYSRPVPPPWHRLWKEYDLERGVKKPPIDNSPSVEAGVGRVLKALLPGAAGGAASAAVDQIDSVSEGLLETLVEGGGHAIESGGTSEVLKESIFKMLSDPWNAAALISANRLSILQEQVAKILQYLIDREGGDKDKILKEISSKSLDGWEIQPEEMEEGRGAYVRPITPPRNSQGSESPGSTDFEFEDVFEGKGVETSRERSRTPTKPEGASPGIPESYAGGVEEFFNGSPLARKAASMLEKKAKEAATTAAQREKKGAKNEQGGGKRKIRKRKTHKRKTHKRKTHKRTKKKRTQKKT